jgi:hypothetical protein
MITETLRGGSLLVLGVAGVTLALVELLIELGCRVEIQS